jgi:hypothetical protein
LTRERKTVVEVEVEVEVVGGGGGIVEEEEEGDDRSGERFEVDLVCFFSAFITSTVADA